MCVSTMGVTYTAARDGAFPAVLSMIHVRYMTPTPAVGVSCLLAVLFVLSGEAVAILEYLGFITCVISSGAIGVLLYLRWKEPNRKRPFKILIVVPVVTLGLLVSLSMLGFIKDPKNNGIGLLIGLAGIPVYLVFVQWNYKPSIFNRTINAGYIFMQKLFIVLLPEGTSSTDSTRHSSAE